MEIIQSIQNRIYAIRGERVMLDFDLAALYETEARLLNQAVKRNASRFPADFMFQLSKEEWEFLEMERRSLSEPPNALRSQIVILKTGRGQHRKYMPQVFTQLGISMLSSVLHTEKAIQMNIAIMRAFVDMKRVTLHQLDLKTQLQELKDRMGEHDVQLNQLYDALENLLDDKAEQRKWDERERIGFK